MSLANLTSKHTENIVYLQHNKRGNFLSGTPPLDRPLGMGAEDLQESQKHEGSLRLDNGLAGLGAQRREQNGLPPQTNYTVEQREMLEAGCT